MVMYKGEWKSLILCSRCGEFKPRGSKKGQICIYCNAHYSHDLTKKKEKILKKFLDKWGLPPSYKPSYLRMFYGRIENFDKGYSPYVIEKIKYLNKNKSKEIKKVAQKILALENKWRVSKNLPPLTKFKDVTGKFKGVKGGE